MEYRFQEWRNVLGRAALRLFSGVCLCTEDFHEHLIPWNPRLDSLSILKSVFVHLHHRFWLRRALTAKQTDK